MRRRKDDDIDDKVSWWLEKNCCRRFWLNDEFDGIGDCVLYRVEWNAVQSLEEGFQLNY